MRTRRSVLSRNLSAPGPDEAQLREILEIAARVPDHRKLEPWRFIVIRGDARQRLGQCAARVLQSRETVAEELLQAECQRFSQAPVVICVVFSPVAHKTPDFEQLLSTGAVCQHINIAAAALGFGSQWLTGWCAYDPALQAELGLRGGEQIAGFMHIGTPDEAPRDRQRPELAEKTTWLND